MGERRTRKDDQEEESSPLRVSPLQAILLELMEHVMLIASRVDPDDPIVKGSVSAIRELAERLRALDAVIEDL